MAYPQRRTLSPAEERDHRDRLKRCRAAACLAEMHRAFATTSLNGLERAIDGESIKRDEMGAKIRTHKYHQYAKGIVPDAKTVTKAQAAADERGVALHLAEWRDHALWTLLQIQPPSLETTHAVIAALPSSLRRHLFEPDTGGRFERMFRFEVDRELVLKISAARSLGAVIALIALARESEILESWEHLLLSGEVLNIFPIVIAQTPQLMARWEELYELFRVILWERVYQAQWTFPTIPTTDAMRESIERAMVPSDSPAENKHSR